MVKTSKKEHQELVKEFEDETGIKYNDPIPKAGQRGVTKAGVKDRKGDEGYIPADWKKQGFPNTPQEARRIDAHFFGEDSPEFVSRWGDYRTKKAKITVINRRNEEYKVVAKGDGYGREYYIWKGEDGEGIVDIFKADVKDDTEAFINRGEYDNVSDAWDFIHDDVLDTSGGEIVITDEDMRKAPRSPKKKSKGGSKGSPKKKKARSKTSGWSKLKKELPTSSTVRARIRDGGHSDAYTKVLKSLESYWKKRGK